MPIDASIPLQVKQLHVPTAQEMMSLQDLATRNQVNQVTLQEKQMELGKRNALQDLARQPGMVEPDGSPTADYIAGAMRIDPTVGAGLAKDAYTLQTLRNQMDTKVTEAKRSTGEAALQTFQDALKRGMDKDAAWAYAKGETQKNVEANIASGSYSGIPDQVRQRLKQLPDTVEALMSHQRSIGGKVPEPDETPFAKELRAAGFKPGTPEYTAAMRAKVAKDTAPPASLVNMTNMPDAQTLKDMAQQYLAGDKSVITGLGRSPVTLNALRTAISKEMRAQNMTPAHVAVKLAEFEGVKAAERTAGTREAQLGFAAHELDQFLPLAAKAIDAVPRTGFKPINQLIQAGENQWSPQQAALVAANRAVINAFAMVASRGVATVHNTEEAEKMLNTAQSHDVYKATLKQLKLEVDAAMKAPGLVRKDISKAVTGETPQEAPKGNYSDAEKERRYQEWKAKQGG